MCVCVCVCACIIIITTDSHTLVKGRQALFLYIQAQTYKAVIIDLKNKIGELHHAVETAIVQEVQEGDREELDQPMLEGTDTHSNSSSKVCVCVCVCVCVRVHVHMCVCVCVCMYN